MNSKLDIIIISRNEATARKVVHALDSSLHVKKVIVDPGENRKRIFRKRIKKIGFVAFSGQLLFRFLAMPILNYTSRQRKAELTKSYIKNRNTDSLPSVSYIDNINSIEGNEFLKSLKPDAVVVVTRRIISKRTLNEIDIPFINIHDGIVPRYRGLFGAYWAMVENDRENCGATVHIIDENLDTGPIIAQTSITDQLTKKDNFVTYPIHQFASALPILNRALLDLKNERFSTFQNRLEIGPIKFIPTLYSYVKNRVGKGIK